MNLLIRPEQPADHRQVEFITREAFWDVYKPGCDEHYVVHCLRKSPDFIPQLSLVACQGAQIIGHLLYTKARVINPAQQHQVLCLGPLTVAPEFQKQGVGSQLIRHSLPIARNLNYKAVFLYGSPAYYPRFGFVNAQKFNITTRDGQNFDPFMALELTDNALSQTPGQFHESDAFFQPPADTETFDQQFPPKEKHTLLTQLHHPPK